MKLQKRDLPEYADVLPVSGAKYTFRPYTVKEQKILQMAVNASPEDKITAVKQIVSNCSSVNVDTIHPTDLEWVFLQLRKTSVSSVVNVVYSVESGCAFDPNTMKGECPKEIQTSFDISNVEIKSESDLSSIATPAKGGGWLVELDTNLYFHMNIRVPDKSKNVLYQLVDNILDGDNVIPIEEIPEDEFTEFVESLIPRVRDKLVDFINATPYASAKVVARCKTCRKTFEYEANGLVRFLV